MRRRDDGSLAAIGWALPLAMLAIGFAAARADQGPVLAYLEFDFNNSNNNVLVSGPGTVVPNYTARLRQAYAAFDAFLLGHATGTFTDNDSDIELIDDGGQVGSAGRSRNAQLRYS